MLNVKKIVIGILRENCYIVYKSEKAIIIDPGYNFEIINDFLIKNNLTCQAILLTHGHFDHIGAVRQFQKLGVKVYIHKEDADKCYDKDKSFATGHKNILPFNADVFFENKIENISLAGLNIKVIHTPGHSAGSCCFLIEDHYLFSGDTIFFDGYGRTDFYDGNQDELLNSIKLLDTFITKNTKMFPGHD